MRYGGFRWSLHVGVHRVAEPAMHSLHRSAMAQLYLQLCRLQQMSDRTAEALEVCMQTQYA